jgi:HD-like signal output (HDOD) protein
MENPRADRPDSERILKAAARLGIMSQSTADGPRILAALCNPDTTHAELAALIESEPGLCARVLRVANSPYYGQSRSIRSIERGLFVLGLDAVRGIAAAACLQRALPRGNRFARDAARQVLRHSIATAEAAALLARARRPGLESEAWIAGLLHNLGTIILMQLDWPGVAALLVLRERGDRRDITTLESVSTELGHAACLALVFEAWHMPGSLIATAGHHHDPLAAAAEYRDLASLVNLGSSLALRAGHTFAFEPWSVPYALAVTQRLDMDAEELDTIGAALPAQVELRSRALAVA